ncbi:TRAP transporter small permease [uncultured Sulfitobacter sp.]|uniref:TRAP transporter small permease n=1 Tax=uncultured Sulfitobacter sp. TaxID=191468 RepID=UPI00262C9DC5|nr:TRAP transporter small permease subunit [uncultured Sulfitobacter sp.]
MNAITLASVGVDRACLFLAKSALVGMVLIVLLQIWARYGFDHPFTWTEELARYLMVWAGLLGATCAFKRRLDPTVVTISENAGRPRRIAAMALLFLTVIVFLAPIIYYAIVGPDMNIQRGFLWRSSNRTSPGLGLNMALVGAVVPLCCSVILLHLSAMLFTKEHKP